MPSLSCARLGEEIAFVDVLQVLPHCDGAPALVRLDVEGHDDAIVVSHVEKQRDERIGPLGRSLVVGQIWRIPRHAYHSNTGLPELSHVLFYHGGVLGAVGPQGRIEVGANVARWHVPSLRIASGHVRVPVREVSVVPVVVAAIALQATEPDVVKDMKAIIWWAINGVW